MEKENKSQGTTDYKTVYIGMPVVRTDGRSGGRSVYGHVITKFSRMDRLLHFLTHGAPLAHFARESPAMIPDLLRTSIFIGKGK